MPFYVFDLKVPLDLINKLRSSDLEMKPFFFLSKLPSQFRGELSRALKEGDYHDQGQ
jgi:hypothetical protein